MVTATVTESISLEDFLANPPEHMECIDGQLVETTGMTLRPSRIHSRLNCYWVQINESCFQASE
jgi:hypothetical protein